MAGQQQRDLADVIDADRALDAARSLDVPHLSDFFDPTLEEQVVVRELGAAGGVGCFRHGQGLGDGVLSNIQVQARALEKYVICAKNTLCCTK
ncbi:hypothetical protein [Aquimonas voraii]|uniref:hypothetical protein n=1 Tax=Aquimonas voraii TaxID=265719 RepID=UPI001FE12AF3|nr:hypothetical protein [Aquimonas voraii]